MKKILYNLMINIRTLWYKLCIRDKNISIICNDCCGGCIYHDIGTRFLSPTINLYINIKDYYKYLQHLKEYNNLELIEKKTDKKYPVGVLQSDKLEPIEIYFMHYKSFNEAKEKWDERKRRINYNKMLVLFHLNEKENEYVDKFLNLNIDNKFAIVYSYLNNIERYINDSRVLKIKHLVEHKPGEVLHRYGKFQKRYLEDINYIKLLNSIK